MKNTLGLLTLIGLTSCSPKLDNHLVYEGNVQVRDYTNRVEIETRTYEKKIIEKQDSPSRFIPFNLPESERGETNLFQFNRI